MMAADDQNAPVGALGRLLAGQLAPERVRAWRMAMFVVLAAAAALGIVIPNHHPHFVYDAKPLFWPVFGLACGLILVFVVKKVIQPIIKRGEDHYGDL
jgi:peptidoglycan/LPS O-acetylase OafA/YrhL